MPNKKLRIFFGILAMTLSGGQLHAAPPKARLSMEQATAIATQKVPGTVKSSEFEHEKGQDVYSFDITGRDGQIHEVLVNSQTGKIVSNKVESAAEEAKEAAEGKS